ncbi:MAG: inositol 2-dehydrogenase [Anaerolineae bacterium]|nr:inositol 2-dehydrogenase [Anaerolineae bacterium]
MKAKLPVGVIGLGRMGQVYARHLATRVTQARIIAVADAMQERVQAFADEFGIAAWSTDYRDVLADQEIKAVFVISPTSTHREVVIAAAEAGKAIFCEKPVALTLADTDAMLAAIEKKGVMFQAGFMRRFDAGYVAAKKQIEAGAVGQPTTFKSIGRDPFCPDVAYADPHVSGGLILDMAIHDFDLGRWLMGAEVKRVYTEGGLLACPQLKAVGDIDNAVVNMLFQGGALGNVEVSRNAFYGYDIRTEVLGTDGCLQIGTYRQTPLLLLNRQGISHDMVPYLMERFGEAYLAQTLDFVERVLADRLPAVGGFDARAALEIALAATQSYAAARPVDLPLSGGL